MAPESSSSDAGRAAASRRSAGPLIMVVDDSAVIRKSVEMTLQLAGYRVETAGDGEQALEKLRAGLRPDLLLTDIVMPRMSGLELIREARALLRFTPIVALTTQQSSDMVQAGKAAGASAWLKKPTGGKQLLSIVARFVTRLMP